MSFNLITTPWLPVRRRSGDIERIPPWQINDRISENPIVGFAWPRADFNGAAHEFLIGLLSTTTPPADEDAWNDWWAQPPMPNALQERFEPYAYAFDLDGAGPRFLQDHDPLEDAESKDIAALLIDAPGAQTMRNNADLFVKRSDATALCRGAAAMALFTLSAYAPSGGAGHRTSLRGGGPMTTLAVVDHEELGGTLWGRLWPNVETSAAIKERDSERRRTKDDSLVFPWLAPTRTSGKEGRPTAQPDVHPLQVYWGMPRRIRLAFEESQGRACSLTGSEDSMIVRAYRTKNYGVNYTSEAFTHPLSPYYRSKAGAPHLPVHPKPGGITYRLWPGLVCPTQDGLRERALAIENLFSALNEAGRKTRFAAFGYDMDNMKARAWMEGEMPIWCLGRERQGTLDGFIQKTTAGAEAMARLLTSAIKAALNDSPKNARGDYGFVAEAFYRRTEEIFQAHLKEAVDAIDEKPDADDSTRPVREAFCASIAKAARRLFDYYAPMDGLEDRNMTRYVRALFHLSVALRGQGRAGKSLYGDAAFDIERQPASPPNGPNGRAGR